MPMQTSDKEH
ncbi:hypothetical protein Q9966_002085 [Columba livia]|nr:hypothetical protein Q9966_002085 [Columba livia]